jgi:hypothetical protein
MYACDNVYQLWHIPNWLLGGPNGVGQFSCDSTHATGKYRSSFFDSKLFLNYLDIIRLARLVFVHHLNTQREYFLQWSQALAFSRRVAAFSRRVSLRRARFFIANLENFL